MIDDTAIDETAVDGAHADGSLTRRFQHDGPGSVATTLVLAIAEIDGVDPTEMEPIYHSVDPDLLDALCGSDRQMTGDVMFTYRGYRVTVDSHGGIVVERAAEQDRPG